MSVLGVIALIVVGIVLAAIGLIYFLFGPSEHASNEESKSVGKSSALKSLSTTNMLALLIAGAILFLIGLIWNYIANRKFNKEFKQYGVAALLFQWDAFIPMTLMGVGGVLMAVALGWAGITWLATHVTFS